MSAPRDFVLAAQIAAHLYQATNVAKQLSLTAKNARAITARAGQAAVGFAAITGFIQELASKTIGIANEINATAVKISYHATQLERVTNAKSKLMQVQEKAKDAEHVGSIETILSRMILDLDDFNFGFTRLLNQLSNLMEEAYKQIRSADIISSMSKIEASQSGQYQKQLEVIALNIEQAARAIQTELTFARALLSKTSRKAA